MVVEEGLWKTLEELLHRYGLEARIREQLVVVEWEAEAPPLARAARPLYVKEKTLFLGVPSHALAQELNLRKKELIRDLREKGYEIEDIKFQILTPEPPSLPERLDVEITPEDEAWAREVLERKALPPPLRERMVALLAAARARERAAVAAGGRKCRRCGAVFFGEGEICPVCHMEEVG